VPGGKKRGPAERLLKRLSGCIERGLALYEPTREALKLHLERLQQIEACLDPSQGGVKQRKRHYRALQRKYTGEKGPYSKHMAGVMTRFEKGLFAGKPEAELPQDNQELERFFRIPKHHERYIHGRAHAGIRLVQEGASTLFVLEVHQKEAGLLGERELSAYRGAKPPKAQQEAIERRKVMRKARSKKKRPPLLAELEARYRGGG
jgi:hypothetical protein